MSFLTTAVTFWFTCNTKKRLSLVKHFFRFQRWQLHTTMQRSMKQHLGNCKNWCWARILVWSWLLPQQNKEWTENQEVVRQEYTMSQKRNGRQTSSSQGKKCLSVSFLGFKGKKLGKNLSGEDDDLMSWWLFMLLKDQYHGVAISFPSGRFAPSAKNLWLSSLYIKEEFSSNTAPLLVSHERKEGKAYRMLMTLHSMLNETGKEKTKSDG